MKRKQSDHLPLEVRFPPSEPCRCAVCRAYCARPGWWSVEEARRAVKAGYGERMMLELAPDRTFGVLSPAFKGCESGLALQACANAGCNFLKDGLCELHGTGFQPLECRFCHHLRQGLGQSCHEALEKDWRTAAGRDLVKRWIERTIAENLLRAGAADDRIRVRPHEKKRDGLTVPPVF